MQSTLRVGIVKHQTQTCKQWMLGMVMGLPTQVGMVIMKTLVQQPSRGIDGEGSIIFRKQCGRA